MQKNGPTVPTCSTARKIQLWPRGGKEVWGGFPNEGRKKKKRKEKKEPSTIKTMSFSLSNLGSFQDWGKAFPVDSPPHPLPGCFHRKQILGRFQCAPRGRTMRPLKPRILASSCYPGPGEGNCAEGTPGPTQGQRWGRARPAGCHRVAPGKPGSQITGWDPPVVPRYPAFNQLPDEGRKGEEATKIQLPQLPPARPEVAAG